MSRKKLKAPKPVVRGTLPVRLQVWGKENRLAYQTAGGKWKRCTLAEARVYARKHGYTGIQITPS